MYLLLIPRVSDSILKHLCFTTYVPSYFITIFFPLRSPSQRHPSCSSILDPLISRPGAWLDLRIPSPCPGLDSLFPLSWLNPPGASEKFCKVGHFKLASMKSSYSILTLSSWFDLSRILDWKPFSFRILKALLYCLLGSKTDVKYLDAVLIFDHFMGNLLYSRWKF